MVSKGIPPLLGLDHSLAATLDLETTAAVYRRLGFTLTPRGRHIGWGTANYCIMFASDYMELLGIIDNSQFVNNLDAQLAGRGPGLSGLAFATSDAKAVHDRLLAAGLGDQQRDLARLIELPSSDARLEFSLTYPAASATPGVSSFFCQHRSAGLMRQPAWLDHPNGAVALEGMTVIHEDPEALEPAYTALLTALGQPLDRLWRGQGRLDLPIGQTQCLRFLTPQRAARRYPGVSDKLLHRDGPLVLTLLVADLVATRAYMASQGMAEIPVPGERLVVDPRYTDGTILEFTA